jgi:alpha-tubulin suppressor-like RCC1 family protein
MPVLAINSGATELAGGSQHACAIVDERVQCWGGNELGQLGVGNVAQDSCVSGDCLLAPSVLSDLPKATALALGTAFSCAVLQHATVRCWGSDSAGQLGNSSFGDEVCMTPAGGKYGCARRPTEVYDLRGVVELRAGASHACALVHDELRCWGDNESGQAANHEVLTFPSLVSGLN